MLLRLNKFLEVQPIVCPSWVSPSSADETGGILGSPKMAFAVVSLGFFPTAGKQFLKAE